MSPIQTVLSVFRYFEDPVITSKLQSAVKNVGNELTSANIAHLTGNKVTSMDLQSLWENFMQRKLKAVETFGKKWVKSMTDAADEAYKAELTALEAQEKTLLAAQNNKDLLKKYNDQRTTIQAEAQKLKVDWHNADKRQDDADIALKKLLGDPNSTDKQTKSAKNELEAAKQVTQNALKAWNRKLREGNKLELELTELRSVIAGLKKAQAAVTKFKAYNNRFKMPTAK